MQSQLKETLHLYVDAAEMQGKTTDWYRKPNQLEGDAVYPDAVDHQTRAKSAGRQNGCAAKGPIGLLVQSVARCGCQLDDNFRILQKKETQVDLINTPHQFVGPLVSQVYVRARTIAARGTKTINCVLGEVDQEVTRGAARQLSEEQRAASRCIRTGGGFGKTD